MDSSKDNTQGIKRSFGLSVPTNNMSGYLGTGTDSVSTGSSLPSSEQPAFGRMYGGIFRTVKSCIDLKGMNPTTVGAIPEDPLQKYKIDTTDNAASLPSSPKPTRYGGLFRSHRSCANLESIGSAGNSQNLMEASEEHEAKPGLLFGSIKSYLAKSNMVSARDLNVTAPISS